MNMRRSQLLRTSSSHSICVSCACQLSGNVIATRTAPRIAYAQRRRLHNGGPVYNQPPATAVAHDSSSNSNSSSEPRPAQSGNSTSSATANAPWMNAIDPSRALLLELNKKRQAEQEAAKKVEAEAAERYASQKLFGAAAATDRKPRPAGNASPSDQAQGARGQRGRALPIRLQSSVPSQNKTEANQRPRPRQHQQQQQRKEQQQQHLQQRQQQQQRSSIPPPANRQWNPKSAIALQTQNSDSIPSMPRFNTPPAKPQPKTQPPSWLSQTTPSNPVAPAASSWGSSPSLPATSGEVEATTTSTPSGQIPQAPIPSTISSSFVDASRQALLKSQEEERLRQEKVQEAERLRQEEIQERSTQNAMAKLKASQHAQKARREADAPKQRTADTTESKPLWRPQFGPSSDQRGEQNRSSVSESGTLRLQRTTTSLFSPQSISGDQQQASSSLPLRSLPQQESQAAGSGASATEGKVLSELFARDEAFPSTGSTFTPAADEARKALAKQAEQASKEAELASANKDKATLARGKRPRIRLTMGSSGTRNAAPFDPQVTANWDLVRQKRQQQENNEQPTSETEARPTWRTPEDIDAKFQEYRSRRPSNNLDFTQIRSQGRNAPPPYPRRQETRSCLRCGQVGHLIANCPELPKPRASKCHNCGEEGHFANQCPTRKRGGYSDIAEASGMSARRRESARSKQDEDGNLDAVDDDAGSSDAPIVPASSQGQDRDEEVGEYLSSRRGRGRNARRSRFDEDEDDDKPARSRRRRFDEDEDEAFNAPSRGRRSRFEEDEDADFDVADYEANREKRQERKAARQAKKDKAAKEAARQAARRARKAEELTPIHLPEFISVSNLAHALGVRNDVFIRKMEELGFPNTAYDHILSAENASLIAMEYNFDPVIGEEQRGEVEDRDLKARPVPDDKEFLPTRPPVVAIMGHVDHGKTTILDFLRKSSVAASEHGGITQHIGAFSVGLSSGKTITFLDTPGHAAFLEMRKRGATVTDIIVLVVAADDSVKPQTIEAIKHAKAANVPIIVAINKVDKEEANVERVKQDLARHEVEIEDFGGDTQVVPVSGKTGEGIESLEDNIVTLSEILDHRAEADGPVEGWVLEATTKKAGRFATVLVRRGTLRPGNILVAGKTWTRVRTLHDESGQSILSAGPGTPVEVDGWKDQPAAGDEALQAPNEQKASDVVEYRLEKEERTRMAEDMEAINEARRKVEAEKREREQQAIATAAAARAAAAAEGEGGAGAQTGGHATSASKSLASEHASAGDENSSSSSTESNSTPGHQSVPFIVKADVSGSVEAVSAYLLQMSNPLCSPTILRSGVGPVSEFDVEHAAVAGGHIISFNLPSAPDTAGTAQRRGVRVIEENVIYRIVGDVKGLLEDKLPPVKSQRVLGEAEIALAFEIGVGGRKKARIAGCKVRNGVVGKGSRVRVLRGERKVYDGVVSSLKNVKKDVQEMRKGTECGVGFDGWEGFEVGDQIRTYEEKVEKRTLQI